MPVPLCLKKTFIFVCILSISLCFARFLILKFFIYPPLHRNQVSPEQYITLKKNILTGASISLEVWGNGPRDEPKIALTFDADMTPGMKMLLDQGIAKSWYNRDIKTILDREKVQATVFLGGLWTKTYPNEAKALADDPLIEIGNHSNNHYGFTTSCFQLPFLHSDKEKSDDVAEAQRIIRQTTGIIPKVFRFPGGCYEHIDLETVASLNLHIIHWDVAAQDGFNDNVDAIVNNVESNVQNGSIVVFHLHDGTIAPKTDEALERIIPDLKKRNFQFVTVSTLLHDFQ